MASSDDTFSQVIDIGVEEEEESFYAPDDDVLTLLQPTSPPTISSAKNIPKPPPLPCITYQRFQASTRKTSSLSRLVPKEAVENWDKLFKEGFGADTYVETDNKSHFPAHSSVLVSFINWSLSSFPGLTDQYYKVLSSAGCSLTSYGETFESIEG